MSDIVDDNNVPLDVDCLVDNYTLSLTGLALEHAGQALAALSPTKRFNDVMKAYHTAYENWEIALPDKAAEKAGLPGLPHYYIPLVACAIAAADVFVENYLRSLGPDYRCYLMDDEHSHWRSELRRFGLSMGVSPYIVDEYVD